MRPTLFEFAGGDAALLALAGAHHARCLADPELNHPFSHENQHPQHVERLAAYWGEVLGGPPAYTQSCGDQSGVLHMHARNGDMGDLGERFERCFAEAMDDAGLPDDPEFRAAMCDYMRWAVADVLVYSPVDAVVAPGAPMPRWSWDGLVRYYAAWPVGPDSPCREAGKRQRLRIVFASDDREARGPDRLRGCARPRWLRRRWWWR
jgi:hemoglobin